MARTAWEYRLEPVGSDGDADLERLNELGSEGWEAIGMTPHTALGHGLREVETVTYLVLLKRRSERA